MFKRFAVGMGVGYVLGAKADQQVGHDQITALVERALEIPFVERLADSGRSLVQDQGKRVLAGLQAAATRPEQPTPAKKAAPARRTPAKKATASTRPATKRAPGKKTAAKQAAATKRAPATKRAAPAPRKATTKRAPATKATKRPPT